MALEYDCKQITFEFENNNNYTIGRIVVAPFFQHIPSVRFPQFSELHFREAKIQLVVNGRHHKLYDPLTASNIVILFACNHTTHTLFGIKPQSELAFINDKFYKRATYSDIGKKNKEGLKAHNEGHLVYYMTECANLNSNQALHESVADALRRGVFEHKEDTKNQ